MIFILICLLIMGFLSGALMDMIFKDPDISWHPIVLMGRSIAFLERKFNHGAFKRLKGTLSAVSLILLTFTLVLLFLAIISHSFSWSITDNRILLQVLFIIVFVLFYAGGVFFSLSGSTLIKEVRNVFKAVDRSLEEGRTQVARIVGRDTQSLSRQEVQTAALETLSENLSDGVVAPMFWYALLGLPGMFAYKMTNTLDSMIGYKNKRYADFGRFAARFDDFANYIPARLTAVLMVLASGNLKHWMFVRRYARCHASPNSGYPESALAAILNCRFGGPHDYFGVLFEKPYIGHNERALNTADMEKAVKINVQVEIMMTILAAAIHIFILKACISVLL